MEGGGPMMISEYSFSWLREAEEDRLQQELERRRVIAERLEEARHEHPVTHGRARDDRRPAGSARVSPAGGTM
jgi:hypothetical protein